MDFEVIYNQAQPFIEQLKLYNLEWILAMIVSSYLCYILGKSVGKSNILISKKQKKQIEQFEGQKDQMEKLKYQLQNENKTIKRITLIFAPITFAVQFGIYYFNLLDTENHLYFILVTILLIFVDIVYMMIEKNRITRIKNRLELSQKEVENLVQEIVFNLGNEVIAQIKKQIIKKEIEELKIQNQQKTSVIEQQIEQKYKQQMEDLKNKIKALEDKEYLQAINFKRNNQQHKTEPTPVSVPKENDEKVKKLQLYNEYLQQESLIQKNMISKVIAIEWCPECLELNVHCIQAFFEKAKQIGEEYKQNLQHLENQYKIQSDQQKQI